jgi:hypothetical protein
MTVDPVERPAGAHAPDDTTADRVDRICPYLTAEAGTWRSASVAREHRCGAVNPPAPLRSEKQRRLCLTAEHATCVSFHAAQAARPRAPDRPTVMTHPFARTTPVILDHGRLAIAIPALRADRTTGQAALVMLMAVAFAAIILARFTGGGTPTDASDLSPGPGSTAGVLAATHAPSTPTTQPVASSAGSGGPAASASAAPATRTYKVKAKDTLVGIAAKYGVSPKALAALNGIKDASSLKIGQVLKIP